MYGEATLVIVDLPSGRKFIDPEDGICPPGTRSADKADASVPRETVVSLGHGFAVDVAGAVKYGIGSASIFVTISELSVINEILFLLGVRLAYNTRNDLTFCLFKFELLISDQIGFRLIKNRFYFSRNLRIHLRMKKLHDKILYQYMKLNFIKFIQI